MTNYNDGKWHGWNGGELMLHPETIIEYLWNGSGGVHHDKGSKVENVGPLRSSCGRYYLIAFRVINEHKDQRDFWLLDGEVYDTYPHDIRAIHVREVLE